MRTAFKILLATGLMASAQVAYGQELPPPSDCENSELGCGHPTPTPSLPNIPGAGVGRTANFFTNSSNSSGPVIEGGAGYSTGSPVIFLFGQPYANQPYDDRQFNFGTGDASVSFQTSTGVVPSVTASAYLADVHGRSDVGAGLSYSLVLHAGSDAIADAIQSLLPSGQFASAFGRIDLSATGIGHSTGSVTNGFAPPNFIAPLASLTCNTTDRASGCGAHNFNVGVSFVRGDQFANGVSSDFYAVLNLLADASSGYDGLGHAPGSSSAYVDPKVTLSRSLTSQFPNLSLTINGVGNNTLAVGGVPEPSVWAMLLVGFGAIGAGMRSRKRRERGTLQPVAA